MVPRAGLEPARSYSLPRILSPVRLPISPPRQFMVALQHQIRRLVSGTPPQLFCPEACTPAAIAPAQFEHCIHQSAGAMEQKNQIIHCIIQFNFYANLLM